MSKRNKENSVLFLSKIPVYSVFKKSFRLITIFDYMQEVRFLYFPVRQFTNSLLITMTKAFLFFYLGIIYTKN